LIAGATLCSLGSGIATASDPVVFSFATVGDSRQDPASPDPTTLLEAGEPGAAGEPSAPGYPSLTGSLLPQDAQWLQNTKAIARILRSIQAEKPNLLVFNGDMIYGYGRPTVPSAWATTPPTTVAAVTSSDLVFEYLQYAFWRGLVAPMFETGTYVVAVPGNHETQCNSKDTSNTGASGCASGKNAYVENENAFRANMGDIIEDIQTNLRFQNVSGVAPVAINGFTTATAPISGGNNGNYTTANTAGPPVTNSQEVEMSYSFDITPTGTLSPELLHFVVINTDQPGANQTAPSDWLAADLTAAKQRAAAAGATPKYFVFGHKPYKTYDYNLVNTTGSNQPVSAGGLDSNTTTDSTSTIVTDGVSLPTGGKYQNAFWAVIAHYNATYFSGHEHIVHVQQFPDPSGSSSNTPYQVIVGAGGSPFDDTLDPVSGGYDEPTPFVNPWDRFYGWALVQVHQSGTVTMSVQGFNDGAVYAPSTTGPSPITSVTASGPTQVLYTISPLQ
jgi:hypothetical protein